MLGELAERSSPPAVVAADRRDLCGRSDEDCPAAAGKLAVDWSAAATRGALAREAQRKRAEPPTRCRWRGCAGHSGVMLGLLLLTSSITWTGSSMSTTRWDLQVCRHHVRERSHENVTPATYACSLAGCGITPKTLA